MVYHVGDADGYILSDDGYAMAEAATGPVTLEDWESTTISTDYDGDTADFTLDTGLAIEGTYCALTTPSGGGTLRMYADNPANNVEYDTDYRFWVRATNGNAFAGIMYFVNSDWDTAGVEGYALFVDTGSTEGVKLETVDGGSGEIAEIEDTAIVQDEWFEIEFSIDSATDTHSFDVYDDTGTHIGGDSGSDTTYTRAADNTWGWYRRNLTTGDRQGAFDHFREVV